MAEHSRYSVKGNEGKKVLENKLGIKDQKILEDTETLLLKDTYLHFLALLKEKELTHSVKFIFQIHSFFFGPLYIWAGKIRNVEISKNGILFCASSQIPKELKNLDEILIKSVPSNKDNKNKISEKLAKIHCEFNAIHPFREGNGRVIRLFLDLIAVNYGYSLIDYAKGSKKDYINACIEGMSKNYNKMQKIIYKGLKK